LGVARDVTDSRERAQRLEEANIALKVLLRHREEDRQDLEEQFLTNFRKLIMPSLEKLRKTGLTPRQSAYVDVVEMNIAKVFSASGAATGLSHLNFTPIEMRIVEFIKDDKTTKEIGSLLNLSPRTVEYYATGSARSSFEEQECQPSILSLHPSLSPATDLFP